MTGYKNLWRRSAIQQAMRNDQWKIIRLADVINIIHGYAFDGQYFRDKPEGDILLTPGNFAIGGGFKDDKFKYYVGPVPTDYVLTEGDLIVTMTDLSKTSDTLGYPARVPAATNHRFLHNQRLGKIIVTAPDEIDRNFLFYLLCSKPYRNEVLATATGTTVRHTSPNRMKNYRCLIPPLQEQRAIAHILDDLTDRIELNSRMNETLMSMAHALYKSWFIDFDPVRMKAEAKTKAHDPDRAAITALTGRHKDMLATLHDNILGSLAATAALFPDTLVDSDFGPIPAGWEVKTIGECADIVGGSTPSTLVANYWDGDIAWATARDMSRLNSPVLLETERRITDVGLSTISSGLLPRGTVLLSSRAPIGYLAITEIPVAINQGFIAMKPTKGVSSLLLYQWASENMDEIKARANGSTFQETGLCARYVA